MALLNSLYDIIRATWTWTLFAIIVSVACSLLHEYTSYATWVNTNVKDTSFLGVIGTTLGFLVSGTVSTLLGRNQTCIGAYSGACGSCLNIATFLRGFSIKRQKEVSAILRSLVFAIKYEYRTIASDRLNISLLPLADQGGREQLARTDNGYHSTTVLFARLNHLTKRKVSVFQSLLLMLTEEVNQKGVKGELDSRDLDVLYQEMRALSGYEAVIGGTSSYAKPAAFTLMQSLLFFAYFVGTIAIQMSPLNGWNSIWTSIVFISTFTSVIGVASLYANPFNITSENIGQASYISETAKGTAVAIEEILGPAVVGLPSAMPKAPMLMNHHRSGEYSMQMGNHKPYEL